MMTIGIAIKLSQKARFFLNEKKSLNDIIINNLKTIYGPKIQYFRFFSYKLRYNLLAFKIEKRIFSFSGDLM